MSIFTRLKKEWQQLRSPALFPAIRRTISIMIITAVISSILALVYSVITGGINILL